MSVKVNLDEPAATLADFTFAYLVTVDTSYHAHRRGPNSARCQQQTQ